MSDKVVETPLQNDAFRYLVLFCSTLGPQFNVVHALWSVQFPRRLKIEFYCSVLTILSLIVATLSARSALKAIHWLQYFVLDVILFLSSNYPWYVSATSWYSIPRDASRSIIYKPRASFNFTFVMSWNFCTRAR